MFPNHITLTINKRLKTESQRKHLLQLKKDIFDPKKNPLDTLKNMGFPIITKMSEVTSMQNICYSDYRTRDVNKHVHNKLIEKSKHTVVIDNTHYWPGLELIYKSKKNKNNKLFLKGHVVNAIGNGQQTFAGEQGSFIFCLFGRESNAL